MFWNGSRWTDEHAPETPAPPKHRRARDWLASGVMLVGVVALAVPFAQTRFSHPQVHHGYQSRPCAKCHPNGYATSFCTCHNGNPPND